MRQPQALLRSLLGRCECASRAISNVPPTSARSLFHWRPESCQSDKALKACLRYAGSHERCSTKWQLTLASLRARPIEAKDNRTAARAASRLGGHPVARTIVQPCRPLQAIPARRLTRIHWLGDSNRTTFSDPQLHVCIAHRKVSGKFVKRSVLTLGPLIPICAPSRIASSKAHLNAGVRRRMEARPSVRRRRARLPGRPMARPVRPLFASHGTAPSEFFR